MIAVGKDARRKRPPPKPWRRTTRGQRCPVCRHAGCLFAGPHDRPTAVICVHVESREWIGELGWLHVLDDRGPVWSAWFASLSKLVHGGERP